MEKSEYIILLERFLKGETTHDEERILVDWFKCVVSRDESVGHQRLPAYLQPVGIAHRGVEPVEQLPASVAAQPPDDARGVHRFRVAERYYFRPFPLRDGFQHRERLGGVLHRFSLKVVSP